MELYATGFNAHSQLTFPTSPAPSSPSPSPVFSPSPSAAPSPTSSPQKSPQDIHKFRKVLTGTSIRLLFAGWSTTVVDVDGTLRSSNDGVIRLPAGISAADIKAVFGDHTGVLGALTRGGEVLVYKDGEDDHDEAGRGGELCFKRHEEGAVDTKTKTSRPTTTSIAHLTMSGTGLICVSPSSAPSSTSTASARIPFIPPLLIPPPTHDLYTHPSLISLLVHGISSPPPLTPPKTTTAHIPTLTLPQAPTHLTSNTNTFTALLPTGSLYTWGDPRHVHILGRTPSSLTPAQEPGLVTALDGIPVRKVVSAGWMTAAVSVEGDLYVWGGGSANGGDGGGKRIRCLPGKGKRERERKRETAGEVKEEDEEVALVDVAGGVDIADVGVGAGHMLALTRDGRVFAVGDDRSGQVGAGEGLGRHFCEEWVEVELGQGFDEERERKVVVGVECGYWSSFVLVRVE
ncbi:hypothetical protein MMC16_002092 [Acarospora aff. strigata]|nr:hypothetical protein [Acarospora aff. strigata]